MSETDATTTGKTSNRAWADEHLSAGRRAWLGLLDLAAPRRALLGRHFARMDADAGYREEVDNLMSSRGYAKATSTNQSTPWLSSGPRSADAEILGQLPKLRNRSRELGRDDPLGKGVKRKKVDGYVGPGIEDRASTGDDAKDDVIDAVWQELREEIFPAEDCGWFEGQRLIAARLHEDGELWVKRSKAAAREPLFIEIVEGDRVDTPVDVRKHMADPDGGEVRAGVELDRFSRVVAWWISRYHPGDALLVNAVGSKLKIPTSVADYVRVAKRDAKHLRLFDRSGQSRGVPEMSSVLQDVKDLDLMIWSVLKRFQVSAMFAVFIESPEALDDIVDATKKKYGYQLKQDLHPGMIFLLNPGEKMNTLNPNFPIPDVAELNKLLARRIGAGVGLGWQSIFYDFSEANYSSARMDRIEAEAAERSPQQQIMATLRWIRRAVLEDALLRGEPRLVDANVALQDLDKVRLIARTKPSVDPEKDARAAEIETRIGHKTLLEQLAERGVDWEEHLIQLAKEKAAREALGLVDVQEALLQVQDEDAQDQGDDEKPAKKKEPKKANPRDVVHVNGRIGRFLRDEEKALKALQEVLRARAA